MEKKTIEIRDLRHQDWLWTSKQLLFHEAVDGNSYKVYGGLASYANNTTQEAFPSIDTLSQKLHLSRNTVIKSLSNLAKIGFIKIEKTTGEHNVYILLSVVSQTSNIQVPVVQEKKNEEEKKFEEEHVPEPPSEEIKKPSLFERFWNIYPNHANKKTAEKKFAKLSNKTVMLMVNDVKKRKVEHDQWLKGYIPHLATYINQERWNDPIIKPTGEKIKNDGPAIHPELKKRLFRENNEMRRREVEDNPTPVKSMAELLKS